MALQNHPFISADAFVMNKSDVITAVKAYLKHEGYETGSAGEIEGVDLTAANEYHTLFIAAQGNISELEDDLASGNKDDFCKQFVDLLSSHEKNPAKTLVLANPDTPLNRKKTEKIKQALDDLRIVRFWVKEDGSIEWD
ncbi:hypothetical protein AWM68_03470 [Fictibacillus phosphorivorans]|uniref:Uncharacterized protein n=1 Tax=Fictibacillus phosphorivorans TaxID=1221500 RepID=A0A163SL01_9BACL|nr:hypothetical protein [Fictibacillus phosphorivorans]KZE69337.1 hypothetical protein AWM68_03470 [Fictibacillus phosphorivorans]